MPSYPSVTKIEASCDWLTLTYQDERIRQYVKEDAYDIINAWERGGSETSTYSALGFEGLSCGGISWGSRVDCDMLRLSGGGAELLFDRFKRYAGHCTRVDVEVTLTLDKPMPGVAAHEYARVSVMAEPIPSRVLSLIVNNKGGQTFYMGSRSSDQFGRLYDKSAESGISTIGTEWRYEVEFKADRAQAVYEKLTATQDRATLYVGLVQGFWEKRGVTLPAMTTGLGIDVPIAVDYSSVPRQLAWLERSVKGVVKRLRAAGYSSDVDRILGAKEAPEDASN